MTRRRAAHDRSRERVGVALGLAFLFAFWAAVIFEVAKVMPPLLTIARVIVFTGCAIGWVFLLREFAVMFRDLWLLRRIRRAPAATLQPPAERRRRVG